MGTHGEDEKDKLWVVVEHCSNFYYCKEKAQSWYIHAIMVTNNTGPCSLAGTWHDVIRTVYKQY